MATSTMPNLVVSGGSDRLKVLTLVTDPPSLAQRQLSTSSCH